MQKQFGIPAFQLVFSGIIALSWFFYAIFGPGMLCNSIGFIYPAYASYKAIESKLRDESTHWIMYWIIYTFFSVIETFSNAIVYYFPFYFAVKFGLLMWLFSPNTMGAGFVYTNFLKDYLSQISNRKDCSIHDDINGSRIEISD